MSESEPLTPSGSKFRLPPVPAVVTVTPDMASDWLSYRNHPRNRPLSKSVAGKYQADMEADRWKLTPEGLIFDTNGYIISGQHRLKAVANSGKAVEFWVFPDQSRDIFDVVDQGYKRTAAHVLRVQHAVQTSGAARMLAALADGDRWGVPRLSRITTPEILETYRAWPELSWYGSEVRSVYVAARIPMAPHLAVLAQAARTPAIGRIEGWLTGLHKGSDLQAGDPRLHLRNRFLSGVGRVNGQDQRTLVYALILKAWKAYAQDETLHVLRWMRTEPLPRLTDGDL